MLYVISGIFQWSCEGEGGERGEREAITQL